ncbi:MAG: L-histidine N(alpha)-methyltransferase [Planctomycetota bacterium]|nr:L-histidine N(alpha)-methyltransferase [Planctomycetota bacterium]
MKIEIVTPAPKGSTTGNRHTAQRYARIFRELGFGARVVENWSGSPCDMLVALHARKSSSSIQKFAATHPLAPLVVVLTGTDLYEDIGRSNEVLRSLEVATCIVVLQPAAIASLPPELASKTHVILQSADRLAGDAKPIEGVFEVAALSHLRGVKDPFLAAEAARLLPADSKLRVSHVGGVIDRGMEDRAVDEGAHNPHWRWLGERTHKAALFVLERAQGFVQTSLNEGGSIALAEAIVAGKPVLASRIPGAIGMLGHDHPGFFEVGDARGLATLLGRLETDAAWRLELAARSAQLAPHFTFDSEVAAWRALVENVGLAGPRPRFRLEQIGSRAVVHEFAASVREGLTATPKRLECRYFYDAVGSTLFEEICALPEYYLTRAEDEILERHAREIVELMPHPFEIVELGSGSSKKTRRLIQAAIERDGRARYTAVDISRSALESSGRALTNEFEALTVKGVVAEYAAGLEALATSGGVPRLYVWLGSNVGNFDREEAAQFLSEWRAGMDIEDRLVLGVDRRKSKSVLEPAYDDAAGVTARFNLNLLTRLGAEFGADIELSRFRHVAFYDEELGRIEMHIESLVEQTIELPRLEIAVHLARGERIHTENSYKYSDAEVALLAQASGLDVRRIVHDSRGLFTLVLLAPRFDFK